MPINLERIKKELSKGNVDEQYEAYHLLKDFVQQNIKYEEKILQDKASELQSKHDKLNTQ